MLSPQGIKINSLKNVKKLQLEATSWNMSVHLWYQMLLMLIAWVCFGTILIFTHDMYPL